MTSQSLPGSLFQAGMIEHKVISSPQDDNGILADSNNTDLENAMSQTVMEDQYVHTKTKPPKWTRRRGTSKKKVCVLVNNLNL